MGNLVDADTFPEALTHAEDGQDADEASLISMLQGLANRTRWLRRRLWGFGDMTNQWLTIPLQQIHPRNADDDTYLDGFSNFRDLNRIVLRQSRLNGKATVFLPSLLNSMTITEVRVWGRGRGVHTALPAVLPHFVLRSHDEEGASSVIGLGYADNDPANVAGYHVGIEFALEGLSVSVAYTDSYHLEIVGESGADAVADGFEVLSAALRIQG